MQRVGAAGLADWLQASRVASLLVRGHFLSGRLGQEGEPCPGFLTGSCGIHRNPGGQIGSLAVLPRLLRKRPLPSADWERGVRHVALHPAPACRLNSNRISWKTHVHKAENNTKAKQTTKEEARRHSHGHAGWYLGEFEPKRCMCVKAHLILT